MSADGVWKLTISTPMGPQEVTAHITTNGGTFTGRTESAMGSQDITGKLDGDTLSWSADITNPMPLTLEFNTQVVGDTMNGTVKLGMFGNSTLTGKRV
jgi:hypothetical protein